MGVARWAINPPYMAPSLVFGYSSYSTKDFSLRCASFEMTACRKKSLIIGTYHYQYLAKQRFALQRTNPSLFCRLLEYQEPVPTTIG